MPRTTSTSLALPPFTGATRKLMLWNIGSFFVVAILYWVSRGWLAFLFQHLVFSPEHVVGGQVWQLVSYGFLNPPLDLIGTFLWMITLWYLGNFLESSFGPRFLYQIYFLSTIGGAVLSTAIAYTHIFGLSPTDGTMGQAAPIFGILVALGHFFGDQDILFMFVLRMKIKYLVTISIILYLAKVLAADDKFQALVALSGGLASYLYIRFAPRRGFAFSFSERYYALRNMFYRTKRKQAAKKFEVYMRKQNRDVHFDKNGKFVDPDERDPNDKRWMN
jgi:membrane associated rhomboid family serine protease